jgi:hypothetical protein
VHYQESATYYGETPTKPASGTHHYTFKGWDKDITCITKSIEVNPLFNESIILGKLKRLLFISIT